MDWVAAVHINIQNIQNTDKDPFVVRVAVHTNSKILEFFLKGEGHDFSCSQVYSMDPNGFTGRPGTGRVSREAFATMTQVLLYLSF